MSEKKICPSCNGRKSHHNPSTHDDEPPLVVIGWTKQEAVQRFYDLFCRERKQDDD